MVMRTTRAQPRGMQASRFNAVEHDATMESWSDKHVDTPNVV
jgi:hypothetical protein